MLFARILWAFPVLFTLCFAFLFGVIYDIRASAFVFLWNVNNERLYLEMPLCRGLACCLVHPASPAGSAAAVCAHFCSRSCAGHGCW